MLRRFLYLDTGALDDYLSALEGGLADSVERRRRTARSGGGRVDLKVAGGKGELASEDEETLVVSDTEQSRFDRLLRLVEADPEETAWVEVLDPDNDLADIGIGAMVHLECDLYVPDTVRVLSNPSELTGMLDMMDGVAPFAEALGLDMTGIPSRDERNAVRGFTSKIRQKQIVVGELDESDWKIAGELTEDYVRHDLEGRARVIGKVAKTWGAGQWKPLLALPGSSLLPRDKRRQLERTRPGQGDEDQYLEGPALMLDMLAIFR